MKWLQVQDGSLVNLDHVSGLVVHERQNIGQNDPETHTLVAYGPVGRAATPWIVATGTQQSMRELRDQLGPDLGPVVCLPKVEAPLAAPEFHPDRPGQYL